MKKMVLILLSTIVATPAFASLCGEEMGCHVISAPTTLTFFPVISTSEMFGVDTGYLKLVMAAREDAAYFVASNGEVRTSKMEEVLRVIRLSNPQVQASDFEIAQSILGLQ